MALEARFGELAGQFWRQVRGLSLQGLLEVVDDQAHVDRLLPILEVDYSQRARPANPMITSAPAIASAAPNTSALVGTCRSTTHSHASDAAM